MSAILPGLLRLSVLLPTLIVTAVVFAVARPVAGVGIVAPALLPPPASGASPLRCFRR